MPYTEFHYTPTGTGVISGKEVLEQTEDAINDLGGQISGDVQTAIDTANNALNTANTASADAQNAVNTANTAYTAATNAQNTANAAQTTATNAQNAATAAQNDVDALENVVTGINGRLTTTEGNVTSLTTRMNTAEGNITTLQNDVVTAQGTATSAQNTATMARQQAYVLRYSSTAITDNSTIAYSTLDNTDNIKVSDKIIDTDGKIFSIVSVDSDNSTVTVGTALIDLALDANVVHTSGAETINGAKTFNDKLTILSAVRGADLTSQTVDADTLTSNASGDIKLYRCTSISGAVNITNIPVQTAFLLIVMQIKYTGVADSRTIQIFYDVASSSVVNVYTRIQYNGTWSNWQKDTDKFVTTDTAQTISGVKTFSEIVTAKVNGLTPSSLSMPSDRSVRIDISGYFTNTGSGYTNDYSVLANGFILLNLTNVREVICYSLDGANITNYAQSYNRSADGQIYAFFPVRKNDKFRTLWYSTGGTVSVSAAYFIPCQGNV